MRVKRYFYWSRAQTAFLMSQRIRKKLTKMSVEQDGVQVILQRLTHQEIANLVGSSREMISRLMKKLQDDGYISV